MRTLGAFLLLLTLAACGGSGEDDEPTPGSQPPSTATSASTTPAGLSLADTCAEVQQLLDGAVSAMVPTKAELGNLITDLMALDVALDAEALMTSVLDPMTEAYYSDEAFPETGYSAAYDNAVTQVRNAC